MKNVTRVFEITRFICDKPVVKLTDLSQPKKANQYCATYLEIGGRNVKTRVYKIDEDGFRKALLAVKKGGIVHEQRTPRGVDSKQYQRALYEALQPITRCCA